MKSIAAIVMVFLMCAVAPVAGLLAEDAGRPAWCREGWQCKPVKGWQCVTSAEMVDDTLYKIDLEEKLGYALSKNRRTGWDAGCGVGVAAIVDVDYDVRIPPAGFCGLMFAFWRFR